MNEIELAYQVSGWGEENFISALADIASVGYRGIEVGARIVELYEDRVPVFQEILAEHKLELAAVISGARAVNEETQEYEIERAVNISRFLERVGAGKLILYPPIRRPEIVYTAEDYSLLFTTYNMIGERCAELNTVISIHPETGTVIEKEKDIDELLKNTKPERVGLTADLGHLTFSGIPAHLYLKKRLDRINHIHFKDVAVEKDKDKEKTEAKPVAKKSNRASNAAKSNRATQSQRESAPTRPDYCELGKGRADLKKSANMLLDHHYAGWITVELERPGNPLKACQTSYKYARDELDLVLD